MTNFSLFAQMLARVLVMTGVGPLLLLLIVVKRCLSAMTMTDDRYSAAGRDKHEGSRAERSVPAQSLRRAA
jgi:hypothetical protein